LHPSQVVFETNIVSFILQIRDPKAAVLKKVDSSFDDSSDSSDRGWVLAGSNRNNKSKIKASYNLHGGVPKPQPSSGTIAVAAVTKSVSQIYTRVKIFLTSCCKKHLPPIERAGAGPQAEGESGEAKQPLILRHRRPSQMTNEMADLM
jgi:hypothetical protein